MPHIRPTLQEACSQYVHRFTMQHVPKWAEAQRPCGGYYAPHFSSDAEWYAHTYFPGDPRHICGRMHHNHCDTRGQTWPLGQRLAAPPP